MTNRELSSSTIKRALVALSCGLAIALSAAPAIVSATAVLSPTQQSQAAELAGKLLSIIKNLPANSTVGAYEGALADAVAGYSPDVVDVALAQVAGTPGLPRDAKVAADHLDRFYASNGDVGGGVGRGGAYGATPNGVGSPGYGGGGGGSNYGQ